MRRLTDLINVTRVDYCRKLFAYHCITLAASLQLYDVSFLLLLLLQGQAQIAEQIKRSYSTTDVSSDVTDGGGGGGGGGRRRRDLDEYSFDDDDEAGVCV